MKLVAEKVTHERAAKENQAANRADDKSDLLNIGTSVIQYVEPGRSFRHKNTLKLKKYNIWGKRFVSSITGFSIDLCLPGWCKNCIYIWPA